MNIFENGNEVEIVKSSYDKRLAARKYFGLFRDGDPIESSRRILSGRTEEQQYRKDLVDSLMGISLISRTWTEADLYSLSTEQLEDLEAHPRAQTNYADSSNSVYREGYEAGLNPDKPRDNPYYGQNFEEYKRWDEGWKAGRMVYYEQHPDYDVLASSSRRRINSSMKNIDDYVEELFETYIFDSWDDVYDYVYESEGDDEFATFVANRYAELYF